MAIVRIPQENTTLTDAASIRAYLDEYVETGANYFVCSFQWGDLTHEQAMRSIDLFTAEVMPHLRCRRCSMNSCRMVRTCSEYAP